MNTPKYKFKILITGSESVGKTSLIRRYVDNKFSESYVPTLQSDFTSKDIYLKGRLVRLLIYELGGHIKFRADQRRYFKGTDYICTVASFDNKKSINMLQTMIAVSESAYKEMNKQKTLPQKIIIVNKRDIIQKEKQMITEYKYKKILKNITQGCSINGILFTSAKTGKNVDVMFGKMARDIFLNKTNYIHDNNYE